MEPNKTNSSINGTALVEMALVLPLVLLLTFGIIHYGWYFLKVHQSINAARQGARVAVTYNATNQDAINAIETAMAESGLSGKYNIPTFSPSDVYGLEAGTPVTVQLTVPSEHISMFHIRLLPEVSDLKVSVTMSKEGP